MSDIFPIIQLDEILLVYNVDVHAVTYPSATYRGSEWSPFACVIELSITLVVWDSGGEWNSRRVISASV